MGLIDGVVTATDEVTAWRRDLHRHPELLYDLPRPAAHACLRA